MAITTVFSPEVAIFDVCIYFAPRFAPITVPNYASSVLITILFLWHMCVMSCHVMSWYYVMLYNIACYRIWWHVRVLYAIVCMYLGSNSYSVHCSTKALINCCDSWCPFGAPSSSSIAASLLCCPFSFYYYYHLYKSFLKNVYKYIYSTVVRASSLKQSLV